MNKPLVTGILLSAMTASAYAQVIDFYTATPKLLDGNVIEFDGIRVEVNDLKVNKDAVKVRFVFNPETLNFEFDMDSLVVYPDVGIFNQEHIVLNVPAMRLGQDAKGKDIETRHPPYTVNADVSTRVKGETVITPAFTPILADSKQYSVTTTPGTPFVADFNLEKGHVMSLYLNRPRKEGIAYQFTGPATEVTGTIEAGKGLLLDPIKILLPGAYQLMVLPLKVEESVTFSFKIFNANNNELKELKDGDKVRANFSANTWDYAKFKVTLDPEDTLKLPGVKRKRKEDGDNYQAINDRQKNIALKLVDETNHIVAMLMTLVL
ncbi:MAG: hypothetical protein DRR00_10510 [Candidatus Parabeggiatoa sp. nov. 3]|nr:MAG: hypothetical protein DRR00_10510 [Gammaproteobacteria bacterium]